MNTVMIQSEVLLLPNSIRILCLKYIKYSCLLKLSCSKHQVNGEKFQDNKVFKKRKFQGLWAK